MLWLSHQIDIMIVFGWSSDLALVPRYSLGVHHYCLCLILVYITRFSSLVTMEVRQVLICVNCSSETAA